MVTPGIYTSAQHGGNFEVLGMAVNPETGREEVQARKTTCGTIRFFSLEEFTGKIYCGSHYGIRKFYPALDCTWY